MLTDEVLLAPLKRARGSRFYLLSREQVEDNLVPATAKRFLDRGIDPRVDWYWHYIDRRRARREWHRYLKVQAKPPGIVRS